LILQFVENIDCIVTIGYHATCLYCFISHVSVDTITVIIAQHHVAYVAERNVSALSYDSAPKLPLMKYIYSHLEVQKD